MVGARQYISHPYKSAMGGTDMERHRRGWKETRLSKQRLLKFIAGQTQRDSPTFALPCRDARLSSTFYANRPRFPSVASRNKRTV